MIARVRRPAPRASQRVQGAIAKKLHAGAFEFVEKRRGSTAGTNGVEYDCDLDTARTHLPQQITEPLISSLDILEDVVLEMNVAARIAHRRKHGGNCLAAVPEHGDPVAREALGLYWMGTNLR